MMKVFFDKVYKLDQGYQEILVDKDNFRDIEYVAVSPTKQHVNGLLRNDVYILEPLNYYEIKLKSNTPYEFTKFYPALRLLEAGIIISDICKDSMSIFVYNCTHNHVFLRPNAVIGEIE